MLDEEIEHHQQGIFSDLQPIMLPPTSCEQYCLLAHTA
jgi:hypothetical protein